MNKHLIYSLIKSGIRITGYIAISINIVVAIGLLIVAEGFGIKEEL